MNGNTSTDGREWARLSQLKPGSLVKVDGGFTCMPANAERLVGADAKGCLFVNCRDGYHFLDGQLADDGDHLVGVWPT